MGWSLLLPDNWYHIRLDHRQVTTLVRRAFASLPRDVVYPWRRDLEQQITSLMEDARADGGSDVYLFVDPRYEVPLAATGLASLVPIPLPPEIPAEMLARTLATRAGDQPGVLQVQGRECPTIGRRESSPTKDPRATPATSGLPAPVVTVTGLDVFIPFPSRPSNERTLLLSFRTPIAAVSDPMVTLFEAITQSLHWTWT